MKSSSCRTSVYWKCECCRDRNCCEAGFFCCFSEESEERRVVEEEEVCTMCWITLTPKDGPSKRKHHHHIPHPHIPHPHLHLPHTPHHHHRRHSYHHHERPCDDPPTEHLVRRNHITESYERLRLRIVTPSSSLPRHHHTYHDRHPLHLNPVPVPVKLRGPGRKRTPIIPPPITIPLPERMPPKEDPIYRIQPFPDITPKPKPTPPKPDDDDPIYRIQPFPDLGRPSRGRSPPPSRRRDSGTGDAGDGREPMYRIQPIYEVREPNRDVRERTRKALRDVWERERGRDGNAGRTLRRVRGYDVLAKRAPWTWECVSSVGSSAR